MVWTLEQLLALAPDEGSVGLEVAATRSQARRIERVAAGLAELDRWLCDRVRTGLAGADAQGCAFVEDIAAHLVQAKAPGVALRLRALPELFARPDWPRRLVAELALLRLLVTAHAHLDSLPAQLADTVRGHIGYPTATVDVVRDSWAVVAVAEGQQDRLWVRRSRWVRRTLLWGRSTQRPALLVASAPFGVDPEPGPAVGTTIDADVSFYPGAAPLRAVLSTVHAPATPGVDISAVSLARGLAQYNEAMSADPWLASWPVLVSGVTPVHQPSPVGPAATAGPESWALHDPTTGSVDLAATDVMSRWRLFAVSGGRPVTVAGEFSRDGFRALSIVADDEVIAL